MDGEDDGHLAGHAIGSVEKGGDIPVVERRVADQLGLREISVDDPAKR